MLNQGHWTMSIRTEGFDLRERNVHLLLDKVVLIPQPYYEPGVLQVTYRRYYLYMDICALVFVVFFINAMDYCLHIMIGFFRCRPSSRNLVTSANPKTRTASSTNIQTSLPSLPSKVRVSVGLFVRPFVRSFVLPFASA